MLESLEKVRNRFLARFGLTPDDPRRFIVASVIVYAAGFVAILLMLLLQEPVDERRETAPREVPRGAEPV